MRSASRRNFESKMPGSTSTTAMNLRQAVDWWSSSHEELSDAAMMSA